MPVAGIIKKMIAFSEGNRHDIDHFMKVWSFAKAIGELEGIGGETMLILEAAAVTHDIACPLCREKYGSAKAEYQELEGEKLVREFLTDSGLTFDETDRVAYLVGCHHRTGEFRGMDHQILIEADYIANAGENGWTAEQAEKAKSFFRTKTGLDLLSSMYGV